MNINTNTNNSKGPPFSWAAWLPLHPHTTSARHVLHTSTCSLSSKMFLQIQIKNKCKSKYKYSDAWLPHHPYITSAYPHLLCLIPTRYIQCVDDILFPHYLSSDISMLYVAWRFMFKTSLWSLSCCDVGILIQNIQKKPPTLRWMITPIPGLDIQFTLV